MGGKSALAKDLPLAKRPKYADIVRVYAESARRSPIGGPKVPIIECSPPFSEIPSGAKAR
jgi:hypothetical protein